MEAPMTRLPILAALILPLLAVAAPAAAAETGGSTQYRAELGAPTAPERIIVRDTLWHCGGGACVAPKGNSRPAVVCAALARETGPLRSFAAEGRTLSGEELEKCNARAR
jgi:hypothetical protein